MCCWHFPLDEKSNPLDLYPVGFSTDVNAISEGNSGQVSLGVRSPSEMEVPIHAFIYSVASSVYSNEATQYNKPK